MIDQAIVPARPSADYPTRPVRMGIRAAHIDQRADGTILIRNARDPDPINESWIDRLGKWAATQPEQPLLTEAAGEGSRRSWTFAEALNDARAVAAGLKRLALTSDTPVAILSENSVACAQVTLGALHAGIPAAPISPSYALLGTNFAKLTDVINALKPGAIFVADGERYRAAVCAAVPDHVPVISAGRPVEGRATISLADMLAEHAHMQPPIGARLDGVAKILFTSGSSGSPKPVMIPHRMLSDNRQQNMLVYAFLQDEPPVLVDWLPWHHTFGGNNNFGFALWGGGTLHIDDGRPNAAGIGRTIENIKRYRPNIYMNSPGGFEVLLPHLRDNAALRVAFFERLKVTQYGGAILATHLWKELDDLAVAETGTRILMVSGLGSTECGPTPVQSSWEQYRRPEAGLPVPGVTMKLVPFEDAYEMRLKGDCVSPGYWRRPDLTAQAFDEEGYFLTGDAVKPVEPDNLARGMLFDGRISDNFKLSTGTWVTVATLRLQLLGALAPLLPDAVIVGAQQGFVSAIGFPEMKAARAIAGLPDDAAAEEVLASETLRDWIRDRMVRLAETAGGSSRRIVRIALETEAPSLDNGELTDKGAASARVVLARRTDVIEALYAEPPAPRIVAI